MTAFAVLKDSRSCRGSAPFVRDWVTGLRTIGHFKKLRYLNLDYTEVTGRGLAYLKELTELADLSLDSTLITDEAIPLLAGFEQLRTLNLYPHSCERGRPRETPEGIPRPGVGLGPRFGSAHPSQGLVCRR